MKHDWQFAGRDGYGYSLYSCQCGAKARDIGAFSDHGYLWMHGGPMQCALEWEVLSDES